MGRLCLAVVLTAVLGIGFVGGARAIERHYLFPVSAAGEGAAPAGFVQHVFLARDGVQGHAYELPAPAGGKTIVHFHNNRETAEVSANLARALHARGVGVLLVEYRGYGASRGLAPSEQGLYLDAEAALDMLAAEGTSANRVVLWGTSLGTGVAAEMARRGRGSRLVLVTPYTSIPGLVADAAPFVPATVLVADRFDTLSKAAEIHVPTLVIHGDSDEIVPFSMGERVARAIGNARLLRVPGGHHGDLFARARDELVVAIASSGS